MKIRANSYTNELTTRLSESTSSGTTTTYVGTAPTGSATSAATWKITRIIEVPGSGTLEIKYASGNTVFDKVWDDRASLSYS